MSHRDGNEIIGPAAGEDAVGCREGHKPGARKARGDSDQILFGHADVEEAVGVGLTKGRDISVFAEIGS